jgi:transposase InsO family protein
LKHAFIEAQKAHYPIKVMCEVLGISESGVYAARKRQESARAREDRRLKAHVRAAFEASGRTYGSPRLVHDLRAAGERIGRHRVRRLMREQALSAKKPRRFVKTTDSSHSSKVAENIVQRRWKELAPKPNRLWVGDITFVRTWGGWLFLSVFLDAYSRRIVGFAMSDSLDASLATDALAMALRRRPVEAGLIVHTDRGAQYTSDAYKRALGQVCATWSMSRKGNCWDNAVAESFFATLKGELLERKKWTSRHEAEAAISNWIEQRYNTRRRHSAIGYLSPSDFERLTPQGPAA